MRVVAPGWGWGQPGPPASIYSQLLFRGGVHKGRGSPAQGQALKVCAKCWETRDGPGKPAGHFHFLKCNLETSLLQWVLLGWLLSMSV